MRRAAQKWRNLSPTFNSLFGIRKEGNREDPEKHKDFQLPFRDSVVRVQEFEDMNELSTPFSGFSGTASCGAPTSVFQLPFRDSVRKKREEVEAKYLAFNSLFGIHE